MIVRSWRARASETNARSYIEHFQSNVLPDLRGIAGFRGALLLREDREDAVEFLVLTKWDSIQAIRTFAGDDVTRAIVEPEAAAVLLSFDATVQHFELVDEVAVSD